MVYENIFWKVVNMRIFYVFFKYFNLNTNNGYIRSIIGHNANATHTSYNSFLKLLRI